MKKKHVRLIGLFLLSVMLFSYIIDLSYLFFGSVILVFAIPLTMKYDDEDNEEIKNEENEVKLSESDIKTVDNIVEKEKKSRII